MNEIISVTGHEFSGVATRDQTVITATLTGTADYASLDALDKLLAKIQAETKHKPVTETVIDLRALEFMNSSCFKSFVSWVNEIQELDEARRYKIRFVSNPKVHWQKRSLHSLRCFAIELITITEQ